MNNKEIKAYKKLLKEATKKARNFISYEIDIQEYFKQHEDMTLQYLIDYLNPSEDDSISIQKKKFFSREIATNYFNLYNPPTMNPSERNLAIIIYQYFIYRNYSDIVKE